MSNVTNEMVLGKTGSGMSCACKAELISSFTTEEPIFE